MARLDEERQRLTARVAMSQAACAAIAAQLGDVRQRWAASAATNASLHKELHGLRGQLAHLNVRPTCCIDEPSRSPSLLDCETRQHACGQGEMMDKESYLSRRTTVKINVCGDCWVKKQSVGGRHTL